jgi:hypothetical protein
MTAARICLVVFLGGALTAGCGKEDDSSDFETPGPLMRPGWNCQASGCHFPDKKPTPPDWSASGTVFPSNDSRVSKGLVGVIVAIRDSKGKEVRLETNEAGNFHTAEPLEGPLDVALEYRGIVTRMPIPAPAGSCNFCHSYPPDEGIGTLGRIYVTAP